MSSLARQRAARRNGARSRGPITAEGKARAAQNARKHGLNSPVLNDPLWGGRLLILVKKLAEERPVTAALHEMARCMVECERIAYLKTVMVKRLSVLAPAATEPPAAADPQVAEEIRELIAALAKLPRYARRASASLREAQRRLEAAAEARNEPEDQTNLAEVWPAAAHPVTGETNPPTERT